MVVTGLSLGTIVPVAHDAAGPAAVNFALAHPGKVPSLCILNSTYGNAPTVRLPELIELFAPPSLKALALAFLQSPEQFAWLLNTQRALFEAPLSSEHKAIYSSVLGPLIDRNFRMQPSSAYAFAQMTAQLFPEVRRNSTRLAELRALDVPAQVVWGALDPYLNVGVAQDYMDNLKRGSLHLLQAGHWVQLDMPAQVAEIMLAE